MSDTVVSNWEKPAKVRWWVKIMRTLQSITRDYNEVAEDYYYLLEADSTEVMQAGLILDAINYLPPGSKEQKYVELVLGNMFFGDSYSKAA